MIVWDWFVDFWTGPVKMWHLLLFLLVPLAITLGNMRDQIDRIARGVSSIEGRLED
jgi:hypothetical protein